MLKRILSGIVLLFLVLFVVVVFFASHVVRNTINTIGPVALGVPVSVDKVRAYPLRGKIHIQGLVIGNPEGFKTESLFRMGELHIDIAPRSMLTDTIIIREISVTAPEITYEMTLKGSNIGVLQKQLGGDAEEEPKPEEPEPAAEEAPGKKVIIERFVLSDGKVSLSLPGMMGTALPLPLPTIELKDIGKEKEGASVTEVISNVFGAIFKAVADVVTASGKLIGDGVSAIGGAAVDGVSAVGGAAVDGVSAVGKEAAAVFGGAMKSIGIGKKDGEKKSE